MSVPRPVSVRRIGHSAFVAFLVLSLSTCAEDPIGPASGEARLRLVPVFESNARVAPLAIDRVRVLVQRPRGVEEVPETVVDDTLNFDVDQNQLKIDDIKIRMTKPTEDLQVTLELLANNTLLFQGSQLLTVVRGRSTPSTQIPVTYQGPGANVASLVLGPRDTTVDPGATVGFRLDAFDGQGQPVPQYYASWSLTGGPAAGAKINAIGLLTAPAIRDTFYVKVVNIPTGTVDSTRVIVAPQAAPTVTPVLLAAGDDQTCQIKGVVTYCWGANDVGQLGDGTTTDRLVPTPVAGGRTFVAVSTGVQHSCALTAAGQAFCWGENSTGALGNNSISNSSIPVAVSGGLAFAQIVAANFFTCAVTLTGQGYCWGANFTGQLGDGTTTSRPAPVPVTGGHSFARMSAAGFFDSSVDHACAIDNTGQAWCWGANGSGQLGNGGSGFSSVPVPVSGGLSFSDISLGGESSCALTITGAIHCWGFVFGQSSTIPQPLAGGLTYTAMDMGADHVCGRAAAGWVCAGDNFSGQLGDGTTTARTTPVAPSGGLTFTTVAAGDSHTCGLTVAATYCWGYNGTGQLGTGDAALADHLTPALVVGAPASVALSAGSPQSAPAGSVLPIRPAVLLRDAEGSPVPGAEVIFTVTTGGGTLVLGNGSTEPVLTDAAGVAAVSGWTLGATPGSNGLIATVSAGGVTGNPVSFTATGTGGTTITVTWTGGTSTDWSVAGNWSPAQVPGPLDSVVIGTAAAGRQPSLTTTTIVGSVSIVAGGNLTINGFGLAVIRGFSTGGTGVLTMTNDADVVSINGNALFDGGNELGRLSAGALSIAGNLVQRATNSGDSYHPSGTHITLFVGVNPSISFATPGLVPGTSHFQDLAWTGGAMTLLTPAMAHGAFTITSQTSSTIFGTTGSRLTVGDLVKVSPLLLDGAPLTISQTTPEALALSNVTLQNMPTTVSQLVISHPGSASAFAFDNLTFSTTPVAPNGFYLDATDVNGATDGVLTIDVNNATPASGGAFVRTAGGAVVNWPGASVNDWTGAISTDWNTAGNWSLGFVPGGLEDVSIGGTAARQPTLTASTSVHNITISGAGARLTIGGRTFTVTGDLITHTDGLLVMTNAADRVIVQGSAAFQGGDETGQLSAGELQLSGDFTQQVQTSDFSFRASGSHRTVMRGTVLQTVRFCCTANTSGFQNLDLSGSAGINIQFSGNGVFVFDTLISQVGAGTAPWLYMLGSPLTARRFRIDKLLVDRGNLILNEGGVAATEQLDNVTFQNYLTTQTQLSVVAPGGAGVPRTLTFNNLSFQPLTTGNTGKYLTVSAPTGTLVLDLPGATPVSNGPAFTSTTGAATVNWPGATINWTGASSTGWSVGANWSAGAVPGSNDSVVIGAAANQPTLNGTFTVGAVVIASGGNLNLGGNALTTQRGFTTSGTGVLTSPLAGSALNVQGNAVFGGGDETGSLMAGTLRLAGNFTQLNSSTSFVATGSHRTTFNGTGPQAISIASGGSAASRFQDVDITNTAGAVTLGVPGQLMLVSGTLTLTGTATLSGGGNLQAGAVNTSGGSTLSVFQLTVPSSGFGVLGTYGVNQTILTTSGGVVPSASYNNLTLSGAVPYTLGANLATAGALTLQSDLTVGGRTITTGAGLVVGGSGRLIMTNAADQVNVGGSVFFQGGDETGSLTAGVLQVAQNFTQAAGTGSPNTFVASGTHRTVLSALATSTVSFLNPGALTSHFQNLDISGAAPVDLNGAGSVTAVGAIRVTAASNVTGGGVSARSVTTVAGSGFSPVSLQLTSDTLVVGGSYGVSLTRFDGGTTLPVVPYQQLAVNVPGTMTLAGNTTVTALQILGGNLALGGRSLTVNGDFSASNAGTISMTNPADLMTVTGGTTFGGGDETGRLTAGILRTSNQFRQDAVTSPTSFVASGSHTVEIVSLNPGAGGVVSLATPAVAHFQNLRVLFISSFVSDVVVDGNFEVNFNAAGNFFAKRVTVGGAYTQPGFGFFGPTRLTLLGSVSVTGGALGADTLEFAGTTPQTYPVSASPNTVIASNDVSGPGGAASIPGNLEIQGSGIFRLNSTDFTVGGSVRLQGNGRLAMTGPSDQLKIALDLDAGGGDETGLLTSGILRVARDFRQNGVPTSFVASGTHLTIFNGNAAQSIAFSNPSTSRFGRLQLANISAPIQLTGTVVASEDLLTTDPAITTVGGVLSVRGLSVSGLTLNSTSVIVDEQGVARGQQFDNVTFQNYLTTQTQLSLVAQGGAATARTLTFNNLTFQPLAAGNTGKYLTVSAPTGTLILDLPGATSVSNGPAFTSTTGAVTVNWPVAIFNWTGASSTNWSVATNWSTGAVPAANDIVVIPAGTPFSPTLSNTSSAGSVTVNSGAALNLGNFGLSVSGNLLADGPITNGAIALTAAGQLRGQLPTLTTSGATTVVGRTALSGNLTISSAAGNLILNGRTVAVAGQLALNLGAVATMTNPLDSLIVGGNASFAGGSTNGLLTGGTLQVGGNFTQIATSVTSFAPSGTHKTVLGSAAARAVSIGSPGAGAGGSHFQVLDVTPATGGLSLDVNMQADSLISTATAAKITSPGVNLTVRRSQVSGLILDNTHFILDEQGTPSTENFSNVTFTGFAGIADVLLTVLGPGSGAAARPAVTTANITFQTLPVGQANFYVDLTSTNALPFGMTMTGSNQGATAGGNGPALTRVTPGTGVATVSWP